MLRIICALVDGQGSCKCTIVTLACKYTRCTIMRVVSECGIRIAMCNKMHQKTSTTETKTSIVQGGVIKWEKCVGEIKKQVLVLDVPLSNSAWKLG